MSVDLQSLKAAVPFNELVTETHDIGRDGKALCPFHSDHAPSCHIYLDGFHCFSCGAHGDAVDWLEQVHNLSTAEAIEELKRRAGGYISPETERLIKVSRPAPAFSPVDGKVLEAHRRRTAQLDHIPAAMAGRGFSLLDLQHLSFAAYGNDAVFPVTGPDGTVLALKRRLAEPRDGSRYLYTAGGRGTPAWCSPDLGKSQVVLIIEGELNGMICSLVAPELSVMGTAGTSGALHLEVLQGRTVYIYGDGDEPGQKARDKWALQALSVGAAKVFVLEPWSMDACDLAGQSGCEALREKLT